MAEAGNPRARRPIAVFDSGLGGLTVVKQILRRMPAEEVVYLGDSARVPYGIKSPETVRSFAMQDAAFLMGTDPKLLVVACNTASAVALDALRRAMPVGVVGVVEPAAAAAVALAGGRSIGVIGTEGTIASGAYQRAIRALDGTCQVLAAPAPLLVPIVEEGRGQDDPIVLHVLSDYLHDLQRARPAVLILGCTHYPLLSRAIAKLMGPDTELLDPGQAAAEQVRAHLQDGDLLAGPTATRVPPGTPQGGAGALRCFSTDNPERFAKVAQRFLGAPVGEVTWVGTDELADVAREFSSADVPASESPVARSSKGGHGVPGR